MSQPARVCGTAAHARGRRAGAGTHRTPGAVAAKRSTRSMALSCTSTSSPKTRACRWSSPPAARTASKAGRPCAHTRTMRSARRRCPRPCPPAASSHADSAATARLGPTAARLSTAWQGVGESARARGGGVVCERAREGAGDAAGAYRGRRFAGAHVFVVHTRVAQRRQEGRAGQALRQERVRQVLVGPAERLDGPAESPRRGHADRRHAVGQPRGQRLEERRAVGLGQVRRALRRGHGRRQRVQRHLLRVVERRGRLELGEERCVVWGGELRGRRKGRGWVAPASSGHPRYATAASASPARHRDSAVCAGTR